MVDVAAATAEGRVAGEDAAGFRDQRRDVRQGVIHYPNVRHHLTERAVDVPRRAILSDIDAADRRVAAGRRAVVGNSQGSFLRARKRSKVD